jgi:phosphoglycolate phosphatase
VHSCVLFDFEGTIVDFQWKLAQAEAELRNVLADLGFDLLPFRSDNYSVLRTRALGLAATAGLRGEIDRRFSEIYDRYDEDALSRWSLRRGAPELLRFLRTSGVPSALVTNIGRRTIDEALRRLGIAGSFQTVVTRNDVALAKPSGEGIRQALERLGRSTEGALFVGDSFSDLFAARDAGVPVAILTGGENLADELRRGAPDYLLSDLLEVEPLVTSSLESRA